MRSTAAVSMARHREIFTLWAEGFTGPQIARKLGYAYPQTVYHHLSKRCHCEETDLNGQKGQK